MNIKELVELYKTEDYKFFKYTDAEGRKITTHFVFDTHKDYLDKYLSFYKKLPNLTEVIVHAVDGFFKLTQNGVEYFIRHGHQEVYEDRNGNERGIPLDVSYEVKKKVITRISDLQEVKNFDSIIDIISACKVPRFGELAIYDSSLRIATSMDIEPEKVYLHAGARVGVEVLESKGYVKPNLSKEKKIELHQLPDELQELRPIELEHFFCSMKGALQSLRGKQIIYL